jgi:hypothetical protein
MCTLSTKDIDIKGNELHAKLTLRMSKANLMDSFIFSLTCFLTIAIDSEGKLFTLVVCAMPGRNECPLV